MTGRTTLAVLASGPEEFRRWCYDSGLSPRDPEVVYVDRAERLRGMTDVKFIRCHRAWEHPRVTEIEEVVRLIEQRRTHP
ncbi:hypothetical protein [Streptomyces brasiliscabiei]|uniref:hypothetical protein n=1 Tax=Streptomyces brasiliscabiei TaxID=2736302 RepID=UPI0038F79165